MSALSTAPLWRPPHAPLEPDRDGNIEPLLAGDRQKEKRVASAQSVAKNAV
jgi:hypothetical protein